MGAPTGLLATMAVTLLCSCAPVHRAERCSGFRHLENGRTFFRYGGLLVIFRCDPGYKLHGYRTNSCVSGHWSRELPACVGSACPSPGALVHGTSSVNEDVSWAMFSCNSGFKLQGPSKLYCKGHAWNGTKPVCKESDMMSSASRPALQKPHMQLNRHNAQAPGVVNHQQHSLYDTLLNTASKEAYLKSGSSSNIPLRTPNGEGGKMSSHELHLKEWVQYPKAEIPLKEAARLLRPGVHVQREIETKSGAEEGSVKPSSVLPDRGTVKNDSVADADHSLDDMEKGNTGTESFPMPLTPATQVTTEPEPSPTVSPAPSSRILTSAPIAVTDGASERAQAADTVVSVQTQASTSVLLVLGGEKVSSLQSQDHVSPTALVTGSPGNEDVVNYLFLDERSTQAGPVVDSGQDGQAGSEGLKLLLGTRPLDLIQSTTEPLIKHQSTRMQQTQGPFTGSTTLSTSATASISPQTFTSSSSLTPSLSSAYSAPTALPSTSAFTTIGRTSTRSNANVTPPSQTTSDQRPPHQIEYPNLRTNVTVNPLTLSLSRGRRPVCPYPPVPAHGTFYFRNVVNPGPTEYKHYIQYACYPGYTLANGDIHSYCHRGGAWSGVTPVCLELTPCSVNNGGCSQVCFHSWNHNQSHSESETSTWCHCRPGFTLLEDKRTCRDLDECVEGQHQCHQKCVNMFGSFKCSCDEGYQLAHDHTSCTDVDECLLPAAVTGCVFGCVNAPGSFHCQCPAGYSLHTTDGHCQDIDECAVKEGAGPCEELCHNSPGSYSCSCSYGYTLAGDGHGCVPQCSPGYRKQALTSRLDNSTTHREECVDIDECQEVELQVNKCEWQCVNLPGSHRCICPKGYSLQADGAHCKDINECNRKNGGCSHLCLNYRGGYKCACPASHRLSPYSRKKCLPRKTEDTAG